VTSPGATLGILGGTFDPPHKGHVALAKAALEQLPIDDLVILVAEHPGHRGVVADPATRLRLAEAAFPGMDVRLDPHSFTVDAVRDGTFGEHALFIVGADQAAEFGRWKEPQEVLKQVKLAVGTRTRYPLPDLSSYRDRVVPFELASPDVSSSDVRRRIAAGEPIDDLVPPEVAKLIEELGLYR
jgi:nicotinate-nucleotide adenylyltransferase